MAKKKKLPKWATTVTPFSKFLALSMLVIFPILGFYLGRFYEKTVTQTPQQAQLDCNVVCSPKPDKLVVNRPEDNIDNLPVITRTITDPSIVKKLYDEMYKLPYSPKGTIHCPIEFFEEYNLTFSLQGTAVFQGTLNPTGCRIIKVTSGKSRWALGKQGDQFIQDLQNALMLSNLEFYGSQNSRPL